MTDQDLQEALRKYDPADSQTHEVWAKLLRIHSAENIVGSIPFKQLPTSQIFAIASKIMVALADRQTDHFNRKITSGPMYSKPVNVTRSGIGDIIDELGEIFATASDACEDNCFQEIRMTCYADYDESPDLQLDINNFRAETEEETRQRKSTEEKKKQRKLAEAMKKKEAAKRKEEDNLLKEREEYERLKKKFES